MAWRVVRSLDVLLAQVDALAPNRSKLSDGSIGDAAHQQDPNSDHNPHVFAPLGKVPVVCARDFTEDPKHGADMSKISEALRVSRDRRIQYLIFNRRITGPNHDWKWDLYSGPSAHTEHMHVSTVHTAAADDTTPWRIGPATAATGVSMASVLTGDEQRRLQNADEYPYGFAGEADPLPNIHGGSGALVPVPNLPLQRAKRLEAKVDALAALVAALPGAVAAALPGFTDAQAEDIASRVFAKLSASLGDVVIGANIDPRSIEAYRQGANAAEDS